MPSPKRKLGDLCEQFAVRHLERNGFQIMARNYQKKWGEIDIVAANGSNLHFIEVKGTADLNMKPEDNVSFWKQKRLKRAIGTWFLDNEGYDDYEWQIDVVAVFLDFEHKKARIRWTKNVILE